MDNWEGFFNTGGDSYWIVGTRPGMYEVRRGDYTGDAVTAFSGSYRECKAYIQTLYINNAERDLDM